MIRQGLGAQSPGYARGVASNPSFASIAAMKIHLPSRKILLISMTGALAVGLLSATSAAWADENTDAAAIPLPPDIAKDLEILGKGVVGKALPAPELTDIHEYLNLGPGTWEYEIKSGGKDGQKVRSETYAKAPDKDGAEVWKRTIGSEFVEYEQIEKNLDFGKHLEDDTELGYSSRFLPGLVWLGRTKPGVTRTIKGKIESFKTDKPDHVSYHGALTATLTYVGQYEVKTPAGTWPGMLLVSEFDIEVGPAKVKDRQLIFYAKGIGKIAEVEATRVSALLVYHSNTKVAKVLKKYPKH